MTNKPITFGEIVGVAPEWSSIPALPVGGTVEGTLGPMTITMELAHGALDGRRADEVHIVQDGHTFVYKLAAEEETGR
jgi:hypothetical protein